MGILAVAGTAFLWSLAGVFIKIVPWDPFAIACGRSVIAAVFLLIVARKPVFTFSKDQIMAAVASAATMMLFIYANKATTSANAILLQYGSPVYVAVLGSILLREKPRLEHWIAFAAVAAGMLLFFIGGLGGGSVEGNIAAILAGVTFAVYFVYMRKQKDASPLESNILAHAITAVVSFCVAIFRPAPVFDLVSISGILALGIFQIGLAAVLFTYGIKRVTAIEGILISVLEPVFNPVLVFFATGEVPGINALSGGAIIVSAVVISSIISAKRDDLVGASGNLGKSAAPDDPPAS